MANCQEKMCTNSASVPLEFFGLLKVTFSLLNMINDTFPFHVSTAAAHAELQLAVSHR